MTHVRCWVPRIREWLVGVIALLEHALGLQLPLVLLDREFVGAPRFGYVSKPINLI